MFICVMISIFSPSNVLSSQPSVQYEHKSFSEKAVVQIQPISNLYIQSIFLKFLFNVLFIVIE